MTFKKVYGKYNEEIKPDETLKKRMVERANACDKKQLCKRAEVDFAWRETYNEDKWSKNHFMPGIVALIRSCAAVAAACICLLITMPVLADALPFAEKILNLIAPELAAQFVPVQLSDEAGGIRMEVVAINMQEKSAQVYVTMQDMVGNRLDETTDLYDSYRLSVPFDCVSNCQSLGYDPETGVITFLISINAMEGAEEDWAELAKNRRITFAIRTIIGQKTEYESIEIPIPLEEANMDAETMGARILGSGGTYTKIKENAAEIMDPRSLVRVMRPSKADERLAVEGIEFTGMGYVDGCLHVQYAVPDHMKNDNHGYFFLMDAQGNRRMYDGVVDFRGTTKETEHIDYGECIFDVSPEELSNYKLYGYFVTSDLQLEGNWEVKFRLGE